MSKLAREIDQEFAHSSVGIENRAELRRIIDAKLASVQKALMMAHESIHIWHGDVAWPQYQQSPEMKAINAALEMLSVEEPK